MMLIYIILIEYLIDTNYNYSIPRAPVFFSHTGSGSDFLCRFEWIRGSVSGLYQPIMSLPPSVCHNTEYI